MDINTVVQLIGSVGFPIVMCVLMWQRMDEQEKRHKDEMDKLSEAVNNNTVAIIKLTERLTNIKEG